MFSYKSNMRYLFFSQYIIYKLYKFFLILYFTIIAICSCYLYEIGLSSYSIFSLSDKRGQKGLGVTAFASSFLMAKDKSNGFAGVSRQFSKRSKMENCLVGTVKITRLQMAQRLMILYLYLKCSVPQP